MSHTPGPWWLGATEDGDPEVGGYGTDIWDGSVCARGRDVHGPSDLVEPDLIAQVENLEDARLIAASPDLYAALEGFVETLILDELEVGSELWLLVREGTEALTKARGEVQS